MRQHLVERELTSEGPLRRAPAQGRRRVTVNLAESPLSWLFAVITNGTSSSSAALAMRSSSVASTTSSSSGHILARE